MVKKKAGKGHPAKYQPIHWKYIVTRYAYVDIYIYTCINIYICFYVSIYTYMIILFQEMQH